MGAFTLTIGQEQMSNSSSLAGKLWGKWWKGVKQCVCINDTESAVFKGGSLGSTGDCAKISFNSYSFFFCCSIILLWAEQAKNFNTQGNIFFIECTTTNTLNTWILSNQCSQFPLTWSIELPCWVCTCVRVCVCSLACWFLFYITTWFFCSHMSKRAEPERKTPPAVNPALNPP